MRKTKSKPTNGDDNDNELSEEATPMPNNNCALLKVEEVICIKTVNPANNKHGGRMRATSLPPGSDFNHRM